MCNSSLGIYFCRVEDICCTTIEIDFLGSASEISWPKRLQTLSIHRHIQVTYCPIRTEYLAKVISSNVLSKFLNYNLSKLVHRHFKGKKDQQYLGASRRTKAPSMAWTSTATTTFTFISTSSSWAPAD